MKTGDTAFSLLIKYLVYFILAYALCATVVCISGYDLYHRGFSANVFVVVFALIIAMGGVALSRLLFRVSVRWVLIGGLLMANLIMAAFLVSFHTRPISDYYNVFQMALQMADGSYNIDEQVPYGYGYLFNWQTGMGFLESLVFRAVGRPSLLALKVLNLICINLTLLLTFVTVRSLAGTRRACFSFLLMCLFYPMLVSVGQLSNQNVAAPLILILILLVNRDRFFWAGALIPLINFIRPLGIILILAVAVLLLFRLLSGRERLMAFARQAALFAVPLVLLTAAFNASMISLGYARAPLSEPTLPYFKFYQGLYIEEWRNPGPVIESYGGDVEKYNDWSRRQITEAYTERPGETILNNFRKMTMLLGMYDWKFAYSYNQVFPEFNSRRVSLGVAFGWAEYLVLVVLCLLGYGRYYRRHGLDFVQILFVGMVCVYFFVEAWPDYRYDFYSLMFIFASFAPGPLRRFTRLRSSTARERCRCA